MAEALASRSPLGSLDGQRRTHGAHGLRMRESPAAPMYDLRLPPADSGALRAARSLFGLDLPLTPCSAHIAGKNRALWSGPDQWLLVCERSVDAAAVIAGGAVVDVSDLRAIFELEGPRAVDVLRKGCAVDLHPREFGPGRYALTALARVRAGILQLDTAPRYEIYVERSYAEYLWAWLTDAMMEYGNAR